MDSSRCRLEIYRDRPWRCAWVAGGAISHLPKTTDPAAAFVEPLFALSSPRVRPVCCRGWREHCRDDRDGGMERDGGERRLLICIRSLAPFRHVGFDKWRQ